ncbi:MAG: glycosyltransferase family 4 protein [Phycisphaerales bacterium]|nr:glycosyltransferase family 4 protein [Phycisphaerales bacterium]
MHVAYIHQHFQTPQDTGGTRSYEMSKRLLASGHRVSMISGAMEGAGHRVGLSGAMKQVDVDGIDVFYINEPYENKMSFWQRVACFRRFAKKAQGVVEARKPDLVFATSTPLTVGTPGMKSARNLRVPFVFEVRDLWPELAIAMGIIKNPAMIWYLRRLERRIYSAATHCIALSPGMREGIAQTGYPEKQITVIPNASDLELFRPDHELARDQWIGDPTRCRFAFTGAHGKANGLDALIDTAAELKRRGERGIQFICVGSGGLKPGLVRRTRDMGLEEDILWHDPVSKADLARMLPTFDVGLMLLKNVPAFYRGTSPNKFFDYIASGLPVLNNYPGWLAGMIEENDFGKVVPPDDPMAFADACVWFRDHRDDAIDMGRRGRLYAETACSREERARQFVETLEAAHASWQNGRRPLAR